MEKYYNFKNVIFLFIIALFFGMLLLNYFSSNGSNINKYEEYLDKMDNAKTYMPSLDSLDNYEEVFVRYRKKSKILFEPIKTIILFVEYDESYDESKNKLLNSFNFLKEPETNMPEIETVYKNYMIKVVDKRLDENTMYKYYYPKYFMMVGFNDKDKTIVYMFYEDFDLDVFKFDTLEELIEKRFSFKLP